ncbi:hypothetical protein PP182_09400 [Maribacter sp. PR1]|uniref:DUF2231 domain-containing protein n=1 Tax=Maribacter cobaltidurans TaxID=1178778 RepID=A0ABU7ITH5_9FLAO|nr:MULTISPECIES: DUF2231 domain-containing protein [Maribacter]MDC6388894.1 hypothetical protein [Maribacter sp. PR1]MEE1976282.1 DUF2231 domain-containing protein [Maribacter cobaltidurans]
MKTKHFFSIILILAFLGSLTKALALNEERNSLYATELAVGITSVAQSDSVKADFDAFPNLHPMVVHFPIVLLLLAVVLQLIQLFTLNRTMDWVILLMVGSGFIGAYVAGTFVHPHTEGLTEMAKSVLEQHDKYANWTLWSSALAAILKIVSLFWVKLKRGFEIAVFVVMAFSAYSVSEAGHFGSQLVYIEGVGPQGNYIGTESEEGHEENGGHSH